MFCENCGNKDYDKQQRLQQPIQYKCISCGTVCEWYYEEHPKLCIDCMMHNIVHKLRCQWCNKQIPVKDKSGFSVTLKGKRKRDAKNKSCDL